MKIAIPTANGLLNAHLGHCQAFALLDVDKNTSKILARTDVPAPHHEPGVLPRFLAEKGVNLIIAGGMGMQAQNLFAANKIEVIVGAPCLSPEELAKAYLAGTLVSGMNVCDH
jgi:predicted Fe-Mo cluster-binding NifX family protein